MTRAEFIAAFAAHSYLAKLAAKDAESAEISIKAILDTLSEAGGGRRSYRNAPFQPFRAEPLVAKKGRNPKTGEKVQVLETKVPHLGTTNFHLTWLGRGPESDGLRADAVATT